MSFDEGPYGGFDESFDTARNAIRRAIETGKLNWDRACRDMGLDPTSATNLLAPGANPTPESVDVLNRIARWLGHESAKSLAKSPTTGLSSWEILKDRIRLFIDRFAEWPGVEERKCDWVKLRSEFESYMYNIFGVRTEQIATQRFRSVPPRTTVEIAEWFRRFLKERGDELD